MKKNKQIPFIIGDKISSESNSKSKETLSIDAKHSNSRESKLKKKDNSIEEISNFKKSIMIDQKIFIKEMNLDRLNQKKINEILVNCFQNKLHKPYELICFVFENKQIKEIKDKLSYFNLFESFKIKKKAISIDQFTLLFLDYPNIYEEYAKIFRYLLVRKLHIIIQQENVKLILKKDQFFEKTKETKKTFFTIYIDFYQSIIS